MTEQRRTKRRYAHELYPHNPDEWTPRPLETEVPYLYARAIGLEVSGTNWMEVEPKEAGARTVQLVEARQIAFMADAMLQGLTGQEAWEWADTRSSDETGEWAHERAAHYGVNADLIKPYECGPEPAKHDHLSEPDARGWRTITTVTGRESSCPDCTEPLEPTND